MMVLCLIFAILLVGGTSADDFNQWKAKHSKACLFMGTLTYFRYMHIEAHLRTYLFTCRAKKKHAI